MWVYIGVAVAFAALVLGFMPERYAKQFEKTFLFKVMGGIIVVVVGCIMIFNVWAYVSAIGDAILEFLRFIF